MDSSPVSKDRLVWSRRDIERRFGFSGSRYTRVGSGLPAVFAIGVTIAFFGAMFAIGSNAWVDMFIHRGWTPFVIVFFGLWSAMILFLKRSKLRLQRKALQIDVIPDVANFQLSVSTVDQVLQRLFEISDDPKHFVLFHRIEVGLSSMRNHSGVASVGEILRTQSEHDESVMETSFNLIRGLVWAIPILGFIGTVSGLSLAIGGFGRVLSQTDDPSKLIDALKGVTGGLATAFETTLLALIAALLVQMVMTFQKKREEEFLDECTEYCQREVSRRLRSSENTESVIVTSPVAAITTSKPAARKTTEQKKTSRKSKAATVVAASAAALANSQTATTVAKSRANSQAASPTSPVPAPAAPQSPGKMPAASQSPGKIPAKALPIDEMPPEALPVDEIAGDVAPIEVIVVEALPADGDDEFVEVTEVLPEAEAVDDDDIDAGVNWD